MIAAQTTNVYTSIEFTCHASVDKKEEKEDKKKKGKNRNKEYACVIFIFTFYPVALRLRQVNTYYCVIFSGNAYFMTIARVRDT